MQAFCAFHPANGILTPLVFREMKHRRLPPGPQQTLPGTAARQSGAFTEILLLRLNTAPCRPIKLCLSFCLLWRGYGQTRRHINFSHAAFFNITSVLFSLFILSRRNTAGFRRSPRCPKASPSPLPRCVPPAPSPDTAGFHLPQLAVPCGCRGR